MFHMRQRWPSTAGLPDEGAEKRARRSSGAGPAVNLIEDPNRIRLAQVHIGRVADPALAFDGSGAFRSVVSWNLAVKLGAVDFCRGRRSLRALGGHLVPILGSINVYVSYERREVTLVDVPVNDEVPYPLILEQGRMAAVGEVRIVHKEGVGLQVDLGLVKGPKGVGVEGIRAGSEERTGDSTTGEDSERRQPAEAPNESKDEKRVAAGEVSVEPELSDVVCRDSRCDNDPSCRLRVRSEAIVLPDVLAHLEVEATTLGMVVPKFTGIREGEELVVPSCIVQFEGDGRVFRS